MPYTSKLIISAGFCVLLAGCGYDPNGVVVGHEPSHLAPGQEPHYVDYGDRTDTVSYHGGDAVAFNSQLQTENPWPRYVNRTHIHMDGNVAGGAYRRYKTDNVKQPNAPDPTKGLSGGGGGSN